MRAFAKQAVRRKTVSRTTPRIVRSVRAPKMQSMSVEQVKSMKPNRRFVAPLILFGALICQLYVRVSIIEQGYRVEELRRNILSADEQLRQLQLDAAYIARPQRLSEIAANSFGLVRTSPQNVRIVEVVSGNRG